MNFMEISFKKINHNHKDCGKIKRASVNIWIYKECIIDDKNSKLQQY